MAMIAVLLSNGVDIHQTNSDGATPLHMAASNGQAAAVMFLLDNGADVNLANNDGQKPIDVAKTQQIKDILIAHTIKKQRPDQAAD